MYLGQLLSNITAPKNGKQKTCFPLRTGEAENHSFFQNIFPISSIVLGDTVSYYITSHDSVGVGAQ